MESGKDLPYIKAFHGSVMDSGALRPKQGVVATSKPFPYTRLQKNQIRVLSISIDPDTKFLICSFDVRDINASQETFRAISYCWRDPKPTCRVLCSTGDYLSLTESAAEVMQYVISHSPEDHFWIDQLCINQADLVERSAQVSIMAKSTLQPSR